MNDRHAYCIIAHLDPEMLHVMVAMLDHPLNDIYIHIDTKVDITPFLGAKTKWSKVEYLPERMSVEWGSTSQIEAEILIFEYAFNHGSYGYYHMMSGQDLPLMSQDALHDFFDRKHPGKEFVTINPRQDEKDIEYKTRYYHFFVKSLSDTQRSFSHYWHYYLHSACIKVQKLLGIRRKYPFVLKKSMHFVSVTHGFLSYLLERKEFIRKTFAHTLCGDEIFLQSILWDSPFRDNIFIPQEGRPAALRNVMWVNHKAHIWKESDYDSLVSCPEVFALKFTSEDKGLLLRLARHNGCLEAVQGVIDDWSKDR
ncbi:MAG: hypothetical protein J6X71_04660 [Bacteroidales bacterium]|nr:hypothetical protein [Bacteroidales bacterium]